jgi:hypothetical protein
LGRGLRIRGALATVAALALTLGVAATAHAASIGYIGSDGNAYLASPDGAQRVQLTRDGTTDKQYDMAGQTDAGTVVVERDSTFFWLNRDGSLKSGPWLAPKGNIGTGPLSSNVAQQGGFVVFWASDCTFACQQRYDRIVFMPEGPLASECDINCHDGYVLPRWIPGTPLAGFIDTGLNAVYVQVQNSSPEFWFGFQGASVGHFDVSDDQGRILSEALPTDASQPSALVLLKSNGLPPSGGLPDILCSSDNFSPDRNGNPVWSPDGSQIAWQRPDGIYVSPAPTPNADGSCAISPRLVIPGGNSPEWGPQNVPTAGGGGGGGGGGGAKPKVTLSLGKLPDLARALSRGLPVTVRSNMAGRATAQLRASGPFARGVRVVESRTKVVGRGSKRLRRAGKVKVVVKFTRKAKRRYRSLRRVKLTLRVTVKATGAGSTTKSRKITLRRR